MTRKGSVLSEVTQIQEDKCCMTPLHVESEGLTEAESGVVVARGNAEMLAVRTKFQLHKMNELWRSKVQHADHS